MEIYVVVNLFFKFSKDNFKRLISLFFAIYAQEKNSKDAYLVFLLPIDLFYFNVAKVSTNLFLNSLFKVNTKLTPFLRGTF